MRVQHCPPQTHPADLPKIIGHRGACGSAPENTLASFTRAIKMGVQAIELDATVSQDGIPIVLHDSNVDRCTDGTGPVVLKTMNEINALDAGSWFAPEFKGERIPRLDDVLKVMIAHNVALNLEIKPTLGWEEPTTRAIAATVKAIWPKEARLLVSSMSTLALDIFHDLVPDMALGLIVNAVPEHWDKRLKKHHCQSLHCHWAFVTQELAEAIHASGYRLHVYTVNDLAEVQRLFSLGVDAVFTDYPERMLGEDKNRGETPVQ